METFYNLPNGFIRVVDTATAGGALADAVQSWREGSTEQLFFGASGRPDGVAISFGQWAAYELTAPQARYERRVAGLSRDQIVVGQNTSELIVETICTVGNGLSVRVIDTAAAGRALATAVRFWSDTRIEPLFYGAGPDPEGVVISFAEWVAYENLVAVPEGCVLFEDLLREWGLEDPGGDARL
jgi:hypothetical protein